MLARRFAAAIAAFGEGKPEPAGRPRRGAREPSRCERRPVLFSGRRGRRLNGGQRAGPEMWAENGLKVCIRCSRPPGKRGRTGVRGPQRPRSRQEHRAPGSRRPGGCPRAGVHACVEGGGRSSPRPREAATRGGLTGRAGRELRGLLARPPTVLGRGPGCVAWRTTHGSRNGAGSHPGRRASSLRAAI